MIQQENILPDITEQLQVNGMLKNTGNITSYMKNMFYLDSEYSLDDDVWYDGDSNNNPDVHWVNEYDRSDGTHVDGYWRTDPDDDLTNNFSYSED